MEQRVSIITLGVGDLKRSKEFYERLGWRRSKLTVIRFSDRLLFDRFVRR
jgi:catechol 2,3-dioxygenase-like lactoylglutathione lyase family enzyme